MARFSVALSSFGMALYFTPAVVAMTRGDFENINQLIIDSYAPLVARKFEASLELNELWYGFGGAFKVDSTLKSLGESRFVITLTGEIPHNQHMNTDGYAIVACHEIGHIVGGAPYQQKALVRWSSVEGRADYYATNVCMKHYVQKTQGQALSGPVDQLSISLCKEYYGDDQRDYWGCLRIMSGIIAIKNYFNSKTPHDLGISLYRHDTTIVTETLERYPSDQCRIDTMVAGLFDFLEPRCWYKR